MNKINIAICDDDEFFAQKLKTDIENIMLTSTKIIYFNIDVYSSGRKLLCNYNSDYSVCFLDICLDKEDGIGMGIKIKERYPDTILVFVTSFIDFSLEGYKANAFRYLLKDSLNNLLPECIDNIISKLSMEEATIQLMCQNSLANIKVNNIVYIESFLHNQIVHLSNGQKLECSMTLSDFEKQTSKHCFLKPHKSFIVNIKYIEYIKNYSIKLVNGESIPIAHNKYSLFKKTYLEYLACL